jgi:hypothetical protein
MRFASAASDPRLWVAVGVGGLLFSVLALAFALVLDHELKQRLSASSAAAPEPPAEPAPAADPPADTGGFVRRWQEDQALQVVAELERAQRVAAPPHPYILRNQGHEPAGRPLTPLLAAGGCGALVLVLGAVGSAVLLRGSEGPSPPGD